MKYVHVELGHEVGHAGGENREPTRGPHKGREVRGHTLNPIPLILLLVVFFDAV